MQALCTKLDFVCVTANFVLDPSVEQSFATRHSENKY